MPGPPARASFAMKPVLTQAAIAVADAGFESLVEQERPRLAGLARRLLPGSPEAEDVLQAALEDAWLHRGELKAHASAPAWLRRIVVHRALSAMRRRRLWNAIGALLLLEPEPTAPDPDALLARQRHLLRLARALERLPARQAAAFSLRYLEGLDFDAVAHALGCAKGTARIHVQRAVQALRSAGALEDTP